MNLKEFMDQRMNSRRSSGMYQPYTPSVMPGHLQQQHRCEVATVQDKPLDSGIKMVDKCSIAKDSGDMIVTMDYLVFQKALALTVKMDSTEWLGYLKGFETEDGDYHIDEIIVPKQIVDSTSVDVEEGLNEHPDIIGTIHSHHGMGAFFSGTDHDYIGSNNPVMVVMTTKGETKCAVRHTLPCGNFMLVETKFEVLNIDNPEVKTFITDALEKISVKKYQYFQQNYQGGYFQNGMYTNPYNNNWGDNFTFIPNKGMYHNNTPEAIEYNAKKKAENDSEPTLANPQISDDDWCAFW